MALLKSDIAVTNFSFITFLSPVPSRPLRWTLFRSVQGSTLQCSVLTASLPSEVSLAKEWGALAGDGDVLCCNPTQMGPPLRLVQKKEKEKQQCVWRGNHLTGGNAACGRDGRQNVLSSSTSFWIEAALRVPSASQLKLLHISLLAKLENTEVSLMSPDVTGRVGFGTVTLTCQWV